MPRYIDIDEVIPIATQAVVDVVGHGISQVDAIDIATKIEDASTACFVPRSEVEKAKQEVAREMSVEMEHEIAEALKSNYKALSEFEEADELYYRVKGKIDALRGIQDFLAELEKKYIGEVTDNV